MRRFDGFLFGLLLFGLIRCETTGFGAEPVRLKMLVPAEYLPSIPILVRVEALNASGGREVTLWDAEVILTADVPGVVLSTNRVILRNGMGSILVGVTGGDFELTARLGELMATRHLGARSLLQAISVGGTLPAGSVVWSGTVQVTNTVVVPPTTTLTILSNTLVLMNGSTSNGGAANLIVGGTLQSLGTEEQPVTFTSSSPLPTLRWGQLRHTNAPASLYRGTIITRAGRAAAEGGHTGQGPVIRPVNTRLTFEQCSLTDHCETERANSGFGTPGKVGLAEGSDLTFNDCLMQRARSGPEISGTALLCTNTWVLDMRGPDDSDGIYLHQQGAGQRLFVSGCVFAGGDDDGIDTLGPILEVENTIFRDWNNRLEDAKAISVFNVSTHVRRSLILNSTVGIAAKWSGGSAALVTIEQSTIYGNLTNVLAQKKSNAPGPFVDYRITNSILWGGDVSVQSDFAQTNFTIRYCDVGEAWPGEGNVTVEPSFQNEAGNDFRLRPGSPCIDAGLPGILDPDGSIVDLGYLTFLPGAPRLSGGESLPDGSFQWLLEAYPNRDYIVETAGESGGWARLRTVHPTTSSELVHDETAVGIGHRLYRVRLAP